MTYGPVAPVKVTIASIHRAPKGITLPEQIQAVGNEIDRLPASAYLRCTKLLAVLATLVALSEERRKRRIRRVMKSKSKRKESNQ
jgi:hypothetical protein